MSIFNNVILEQRPHLVGKELRWNAMGRQNRHDSYMKYVESIGDDGVKLRALREQYRIEIRDMSLLISSMQEAIECIDYVRAIFQSENQA